MVGTTEKKLNKGFKRKYGATVFEALKNERLEAARKILEQEELPLKQIAFKVGYHHSTNFINAFAKLYGIPPQQYRAHIRKQSFERPVFDEISK